MTIRTRLLLPAAAMLLCSTVPVGADPITAIYQVVVTGRMTDESNPVFLPFEQQFTLRMTFDPSLGGDQSYGPVTFSPIPLESVPLPPGLSLFTTSFTAHGQFEENPFGTLNLFATAAVNEIYSGATNYFKLTRLLTNIPTVDPPPPFTAETFPAHLVLGPFPFQYWTRLTANPGLIDERVYRGAATLVRVTPAAPVPEPATLLLAGSGILLALRGRRRLS